MTITITGDDAVSRAIEEQTQLTDFKRGLALGALHIKSWLATYPDHTPRPVAQFWTDRQRRGFFARLRSGQIDVPYVRGMSNSSEGLGRRWTTEARDNGLAQVVGNNASYAPLVQGARQSMYHRTTGWRTVQQAVESESGTVIDIIRAEVRAGGRG